MCCLYNNVFLLSILIDINMNLQSKHHRRFGYMIYIVLYQQEKKKKRFWEGSVEHRREKEIKLAPIV
jgi:hypothetical protein